MALADLLELRSPPDLEGALAEALDGGQNISIGYLSHSEADVELYLQESFTFQLLTTEAAVALTAPSLQVKSG